MKALRREVRIKDKLPLENSDGTLFAEIDIDINIDSIIERYCEAEKEVKQAEIALQTDKSDGALERYGNALMSLLKILFGDENAQTILDFYEGRYSEMITEIVPMIIEEIAPKLAEARAHRVEKIRFIEKQKRKLR